VVNMINRKAPYEEVTGAMKKMSADVSIYLMP
jgi:hypothetical protein